MADYDRRPNIARAVLFAAVPLKRGESPAEIADAAVFVASGTAAYITGQVVRVNGGKTAS
jgi:NAD(P)-dependent dehydrogenase (short-subunit alcohol dehydrogenase family)